MKKAILATKVGMTQIFNEDGTLTPVTVLQAGPCVVTQIKTVENDGYEAVQVGFVDKKDKTVNKDKNGKKEIVHRHGVTKAEQGHFAKAGVTGKRFVKEFKFENAADYALAQEIKADIFEAGDKIDANDKAAVETDLNALKDLLAQTANAELTDAQIADIKAAQEKMMESAQKLFAKMYEQTQQAGGQAGPNPGAGAAQGGNEAGYGDDVVDADYKEV